MNMYKSCFVFCLFTALLIAKIFDVVSGSGTGTKASTNHSVPIPNRYNRYFVVFYSENVTQPLSRTIFYKLIDFDNYCGALPSSFDTLENYTKGFVNATVFLYNNKTLHAGSVDSNDVRQVALTLLTIIRYINTTSVPPNHIISTQIILITDYATDSVKIMTEIYYSFLTDLKSLKNVKLIALTTNLSADLANYYFPTQIWNVIPNYLDWTTEMSNPICSYETEQYTTPNPTFQIGPTVLSVALILSSDYVKNKTNQNDLFELLGQLQFRRWSQVCSQYRSITLNLRLALQDGVLSDVIAPPCYLDNSDVVIDGEQFICTEKYFRSNIVITGVPSTTNISCTQLYAPFFNDVHDFSLTLRWKFLLITDLPLPCLEYREQVFSALRKYKDYWSGAPLTVIAIDKINSKSVANSYRSLFPPTQRPNLYEVNGIAELLQNMSKSINFCLDSAPWLPVQLNISKSRTVWYFYVLGVAVIVGVLIFFVISLIWRNKKRREQLRRIRVQTQMIPVIMRNDIQLDVKDEWEVSMQALDIDYKTFLGKGAFSIVHSGFLHGKAPVLKIFPSIALQQFTDCNVAVKTLPSHCNENNIATFLDEIRLMKEIGFNSHIVSMLGCNCSIERPILIMEEAEQDLLHWLKSYAVSMIQTDTNVLKTLLSMAWQISDGMSYLSAKNFVHRDLAARNILLNSEKKAMISDFGLCRKLEKNDQVLTIQGGKLPLKWMAPESLQKNQFSLKTDIWSYAILLFEIFNLGQEPYTNLYGEELVAFLLDGNRLNKPRFANDQIYELMKQSWSSDPAERPDFSSAQSMITKMLEDTVINYGYLEAHEK